MWRTSTTLALAIMVVLTLGPQTAKAQPPGSSDPAPSPFLTTNRILQASLDRISRGSALWREAVDGIRKTGRRAVLVTPSEAASIVGRDADRDRFDPGLLAEAVPLLHHDSRVAMVLVVVNLPLLQRIHQSSLSVPQHFEADLDRILVHELYGHGVPYLLTGDLSARCADPAPSERAAEACSIRRENDVRSELRLGRRLDAGLSSLTLSRNSSN